MDNCKQEPLNPYVVKNITMRSGERLPILVAKATGEPLFEPSIYVLSEVRATNKASSTIDHVLRSIIVLKLFEDANDIDIASRFREGRVFSLHELDGLVRQCRLKVQEQLQAIATPEPGRSSQIRSKQTLRLRKINRVPVEVKGHTAANRVRAIRDYLDWRVRYHMAATPSTKESLSLWEDWKRCKDALNARMPRHKGRNTIGRREGFSPAVEEKLISVTSTDSTENPWKREATRIRNHLMISWLNELGLRRGELLNIKISDIDFQSGEVIIARRADDPEDPRKYPPNVKTRDRKIPLSPALCKLTHDYIVGTRRSIVGARRHPYLIVAMGTGTPLSLSSANDVFADLHVAFPDDLNAVTPHVFRHAWNDRFSKVMNEKKYAEADEKKLRSYMMGWSPTSESDVVYTRHHIRELAQNVSLEMQGKQVKEVRDDG